LTLNQYCLFSFRYNGVQLGSRFYPKLQLDFSTFKILFSLLFPNISLLPIIILFLFWKEKNVNFFRNCPKWVMTVVLVFDWVLGRTQIQCFEPQSFLYHVIICHKWCKSHSHMVTQPTIKIEIWSWKAEIDMIKVWHNKNLLQGTNTIGMK
jgi:hypothetical protein